VSPPTIGVWVEVWARLIIGKIKKVNRNKNPGNNKR
jgi:hypothetical protein